MITLPEIMIATPVHNRGWILPEYLRGIRNLDYPSNLLSIHWIVNNCQDDSREILGDFDKEIPERVRDDEKKYNSIIIEEINFSRKYPDRRNAGIRRNETYNILAQLRNRILDIFLKSDCEYLFSVDSDIILPSDILQKLLSHRKDVVAGLISNGNGTFNYMLFDGGRNKFYHPRGTKTDQNSKRNLLMRVDLTGAVILISRYVATKGRYGYDPQGEDAFFARILRREKIPQFVDTTIQPKHVMKK